jgi:hypothetical protein
MNKQSEHELQKAVAKYLDYIKVLWWATPNGGHRHIGTARKLKQEGVKSGVPDICIAEPKGTYNGLFIELKVGKNKVTDNQFVMLAELNKRGYQTAICYSFDEVVKVVSNYLEGKP